MKSIFFLPVILLSILIGCSNSYIIKPDHDEDIITLNRLSTEDEAIVTLTNGNEIEAKNIIMAPDSTSLINLETQASACYRTDEISNVHFIQRWKGALNGFGIGFLSGALPGIVIGLANDLMDPALGAVAVGGSLGIAGGVIGAVIGVLVGNKDIYYIKK